MAEGSAIETPLADALARLTQRDIVSFHALPWSGGRALRDSELAGRYDEAVGSRLPHLDVVYSGAALDSFFQPVAALDLAQHLAAEAFGAGYTFFTTCGTRTAGRIALTAALRGASRVLLDPDWAGLAEVAPEPALVPLSPAGEWPDMAVMLDLIEAAHRRGRPFEVLALSTAAYGTVTYDLPALLRACLERSPELTFVVDEGSRAIQYFHPLLRPATGLAAAEQAGRSMDRPVDLIAVHSADRCMLAAGQAAYLQVTGRMELIHAIRSSLQAIHTTSPSLPILTSLDLARAHAQESGVQLIGKAVRLAAQLRKSLGGQRIPAGFVADPLVVTIDTARPPAIAGEVLDRARRFDISYDRSSLHIRMHIGTLAGDLDLVPEILGAQGQNGVHPLGTGR